VSKYYVQVILERKLAFIPTYRVPNNLINSIKIGQSVIVPLGKQQVLGVIILLSTQTDFPENKIKDINAIASKNVSIPPDLIKTALWMADYYIAPLSKVIQMILPQGLKKLKSLNTKISSITYLNITSPLDQNIKLPSKGSKQKQLLTTLITEKKLLWSAVDKPAAAALVKKGLAYKSQEENELVDHSLPINKTNNIQLNHEQHQAVQKILNSKSKKNFLIHGVTGSGKTQIFIELIKHLKCQTIILVPEISLTPQMSGHFKNNFGNKVAIIHSGVKQSEKNLIWQKISNHEIEIIIGPRSAIFAPFENIGLIIIDEEHETSYKQESNLRYNAKSVAYQRAKFSNAKLILGSATPSIQSYLAEQSFEKISLLKRFNNKPMPIIETIDLKINSGQNRFISNKLITKIKEKLDKNEQIILLYNKRGYANFILCEECGHVETCPNCSVSLTLHSNLQCHYCGHSEAYIAKCSSCHKPSKAIGKGTLSLEADLKKIFPATKILRLDRDNIKNFNDLKKTLTAFKNQEANILLGTQMVTKGHDFANVTLVGIINADIALYRPEYSAAERTFSSIVQVAGRCGRAHKAGEVIIQTYQPDHYAIKLAQTYNFKDYYAQEAAFRSQFSYPPFNKWISIILENPDEEKIQSEAQTIKNKLKTNNVTIMGPMPNLIHKLKKNYRWQLAINAKKQKDLVPLKIKLKTLLLKNKFSSIISIDVDPLSLI
jgi:primosomal protein N' (replication factor Y) (superfamily II helicase)